MTSVAGGSLGRGQDADVLHDIVGDPDRLRALRRSGLLRHESHRLLDRLTRLASSITGAPVALVSVVDADRQFFTSEHGLHEPWLSLRQTPLSHSVCRTVVDLQDALVVPDMGEDARFTEHDARHDIGVEAYCGVPIRDPDGLVLGSFCVIDAERREWDPSTIPLLEQLAAVVTDTVAAHREHVAMLRDLQDRLLPGALPSLPNGHVSALYRAAEGARDLGGDFYDAHTAPDGTVNLVLGDAVGHGVLSTQAAAQLRAASRAVLAGTVTSPAEAVNRVAAACADLPGCEHAALTVVSISPDGRDVCWARAGAMPPVLTGPEPRLLSGGASPPLGVGTCVPDPACSVRLEPGEGVLLFTDGLVERREEHLEISLHRLLTACGEQATGSLDLARLADVVCPPTGQDDDVAALHWLHTPQPSAKR